MRPCAGEGGAPSRHQSAGSVQRGVSAADGTRGAGEVDGSENVGARLRRSVSGRWWDSLVKLGDLMMTRSSLAPGQRTALGEVSAEYAYLDQRAVDPVSLLVR